MRMLVDRVGQQAALIVADIARRRADQAADAVPLHIFAHVEALQRDAHDRGELARDLGLADAGGAGEEVGADRLVGIAKARAGELDRRGEPVDRIVLAEHDPLQILVEMLERLLVVARDALRRDPGDGRDHRLDLLDGDRLLALRGHDQHLHRADLVDHVDRLVGELAVVDVARGELDRRLDRVGRIFDAVMLLEGRAEAGEDLDRVLDRRLVDVDLLEAPEQGPVLLEMVAELLVGGRADAADRAVGERGLEQVRGVHRAAGRGAGADHGVDFVDEQDRVREASRAR